MAQLTAFGYRAGRSFWHCVDVRFKILFVVLISLVGLRVRFAALGLLSVAVFAALLNIRLPLKTTLKELRYFALLLAFVFAARALSEPGDPVVAYQALAVTWQGLREGALVCWRLLLVVLAGLVFVGTTRTSEIKTAVAWFLRPIPLVPPHRIATMMSLIVRFLPVILEQARETADAQRARAVENRRNPLYRLRKLVIPLMRRTFENADQLVLAMESRCYTELRSEPGLACRRRDWLALVLILSICALALSL